MEGVKKCSIKYLDYKRQTTATFLVTGTAPFLPIQFIYQGKSKGYLPKFTYSSDVPVTFTANHSSA